MEDVILRGVGIWLLSILEAIIVFLSFCIGHSLNGISPELAVLFASILGSTQILLVLIITKIFKIKE